MVPAEEEVYGYRNPVEGGERERKTRREGGIRGTRGGKVDPESVILQLVPCVWNYNNTAVQTVDKKNPTHPKAAAKGHPTTALTATANIAS